eukprot:Pompholyxophrys_sp_v1_NODE_153_length_1503_cov_15.160221.p2 type:complete len:146 gc:universal NODE_153_length_1503_cov_15.160221:650-1087(+)
MRVLSDLELLLKKSHAPSCTDFLFSNSGLSSTKTRRNNEFDFRRVKKNQNSSSRLNYLDFPNILTIQVMTKSSRQQHLEFSRQHFFEGRDLVEKTGAGKDSGLTFSSPLNNKFSLHASSFPLAQEGARHIQWNEEKLFWSNFLFQ